MLNGKKVRSYLSKNTGNRVFVYELSGSEEDLELYREVKGEDYYREDRDTGKPLWFSTKYFGEKTEVQITADNKIYAIDKLSEMAEIANQYGGVMGSEIAKMMVQQMFGNQTTPQVARPVAAAPISETPDADFEVDETVVATTPISETPDTTTPISETPDAAFEVENETPF